ncbi:MAG: 6-pyruvoyl-tetrahydropterin synthase-related protein [Pyrinomonadaceae bacterium]
MKNQTFSKGSLLNKSWALPLVLGCGVLAMVPAYIWGIPTGADLDNHFRFVMPFYDEMSRGNFVPGWLAESNNGFGDARFRFYPPLLYYVLALFRWLTGDWYFATLSVFTLFSITGASGVYLWARQSLSRQTSVLAAFLFALVPYHLTQFYQASLLAEFAATSLLPFAFLFVERLATNNRPDNFRFSLINIAGLAVSFALIITAHLPTMVIGSLSLGVFALVSIDWRLNRKSILLIASGVAIGLVLSSWFWVKILSELSWIQAGTKVQSPYYDYRNNFLFSSLSLTNLNTWYGGFLAVLTIGIFSPSLMILRRLFSRKTDETSFDKYLSNYVVNPRRQWRAAAITGLLTLLMTTELSRPIWAIVPNLKDIQFPYRWLAVTSVLICPITALGLQVWRDRIRQKQFRPIHLPFVLAFAGTLFLTGYDLVIDSDYSPRSIFSQRIEEIRGARSFNDWLPPGASELKDLAPLSGQIDTGDRQLIASNFQTQVRRFMLDAGEEGQVRLRSYYYPLWKAMILRPGERRETATSQAPDGTLLVSVPPESCEIEVVFTEPPRTMISFIVSAVGWTFVLILLLSSLLKRKAPEAPIWAIKAILL